MLNARDFNVIGLLEDFNVATTMQIHKLCFQGVTKRRCQDRLARLVDQNILKRSRSTLYTDYMYYIKRLPAQQSHRLTLLDFYTHSQEYYKIHRFDVEFKRFPGIRPDGYAELEDHGLIFGIFIEVHLSNKFDQQKYEDLYRSGVWKENGWPSFPRVIVITDKNFELTRTAVKYRIVNTGMEGIEKIFK